MWRAYWGSGSMLICSAAFLFSLATLSVKVISLRADVPVFQVTATSSLLCLLGTSALVYGQGDRLHPGSTRSLNLTILRGALGTTAIALFYLR